MSKRARRSGLLWVLLAITVGSSGVHAQNKNPNILLATPCPAQPATVPLTFSAKPGDTVGSAALPAEIGVRDGAGNPFTQNVLWTLAPSTGCSGSDQAIQCGSNIYSVAAPKGSVSPTTSAGRVQITTPLLADTDVGKQGAFGTTVTQAPAGAGDPQCTWNYLLRVTEDGGGWGDPHLTTIDKKHYDFQSAGELTALRETGFEVQTRQAPVPTTSVPGVNEYTGLGVCVAIYTAVAARIGSNRVTFQPDAAAGPGASRDNPTPMQLRVNGQPVTLGERGIDLRAGGGGSGALEGQIRPAGGGAIEITDVRGTQLVVTPTFWTSQQKWYLNINVFQTSAIQGTMGITKDGWLPALPNGTSLGQRPESAQERYQQLYETFADAWRVTDATSLFDYAAGTNTATFTLKEWPRFNPQSCALQGQTSVQPATQQVAEAACAAVTDAAQKADCIFDVMVTGETGFGQSYVKMQQFRPNGSGFQPGLVAVQGVPPPPPPPWPWWLWILILIIVLIIIVLIVKRKKTP